MLVRNMSVAALLMVLSSGSSAIAQDGVVLKYQFQKDEPVVYRTTTEMNQTMQVAGQTYENKVTQSEVNSLTLEEVTQEGHLKLKHVNHRLSIKAEMGPEGSYNFDSQSSEREKGTSLSSELNPVYESLSGAEYHITLTPQGKVVKLEGYKEVLENIRKDSPIAALTTGGGSEETLKESLAEMFFLLPGKPVKEGDAWEVPFKLDIAQVGKAEGKRVYKYEGALTKDDAEIARISVRTEAAFDFDLDTEDAKITGQIGIDSSEGDVRFDVGKGQVVTANLEYATSGTINTMRGDVPVKIAIKQTKKRSTQRLSALPD